MPGSLRISGAPLAGAPVFLAGLLVAAGLGACGGAPEHCRGCLAALADAGAFIQEVGVSDKPAGGSGGAGTIRGSGGSTGTGGLGTGGTGTGGAGTGGAGSGGTPGSGGSATGGSGTGGQGTGGAGTGGAGTGGRGTGGAQTGGSGSAGRGTGGAATGGRGTGGAATGGRGTGGAADTAYYNFETSTQSWTMAAGTPVFNVNTSTTQRFVGQRSLGASITATATTTYFIEVNPPTPAIPAGARVTFHVFVPSGTPIAWIQPYVQDNTSAFTGVYTTVGGLTLGGWTTIMLTVPSAATQIVRLGVQVNVTAAWTGTIYIDTVSW